MTTHTGSIEITSEHVNECRRTTRTLHIVDLENIIGNPLAPKAQALNAFERFLDRAEYRDRDHLIVAANPGLMGEVAFDLPVPCNKHAARGKDGADFALLEYADPSFVRGRYDRLVIGSGDGAFADTALAAARLGLHVVVVCRPGSLNSRFRGSGLGIRLLPGDGDAFAA